MLDVPAGSRITAIGAYRPEAVVDSDEVGRRCGVSGEWIRSRTGIVNRRVAGRGETVVGMAAAAARDALGRKDLDIDLVIVATSTADTPIPSVAARVAAALDLPRPGAFDVNTACAGFCSALACADSLIRAGSARRALVIGSDKPTDWLDWGDRDTAILFGDGAGAVVLEPAETQLVGPVLWGSIGESADLIGIGPSSHVLEQDGQAVFRWATSLAPIAKEVCVRSSIDPADLAAFVPHQANLRIVHRLARGLGLSDAVVADDITESGNTIAATIPLALKKLEERGDLPYGKPVLLFGFGAGLSYAGQVVVLE
ncbi:beta-ketoacyl-ACP synthase 3 [Actinomadura sp. KC06]|uniref:beta-ketoacyl-ACP synthase 3 n=1 Tax=Actinomadura sp. KC06 TaxID=2530369 RepID=UPI0010488EA6|nr:beta-ketoacyl-ACP synthase 3 [Actinomadura sp. KC06]TDD34944.1 beta-ketoacyl-ACP synthase 3 [Actinomadura sp. KC06]